MSGTPLSSPTSPPSPAPFAAASAAVPFSPRRGPPALHLGTPPRGRMGAPRALDERERLELLELRELQELRDMRDRQELAQLRECVVRGGWREGGGERGREGERGRGRVGEREKREEEKKREARRGSAMIGLSLALSSLSRCPSTSLPSLPPHGICVCEL